MPLARVPRWWSSRHRCPLGRPGVEGRRPQVKVRTIGAEVVTLPPCHLKSPHRVPGSQPRLLDTALFSSAATSRLPPLPARKLVVSARRLSLSKHGRPSGAQQFFWNYDARVWSVLPDHKYEYPLCTSALHPPCPSGSPGPGPQGAGGAQNEQVSAPPSTWAKVFLAPSGRAFGLAREQARDAPPKARPGAWRPSESGLHCYGRGAD